MGKSGGQGKGESKGRSADYHNDKRKEAKHRKKGRKTGFSDRPEGFSMKEAKVEIRQTANERRREEQYEREQARIKAQTEYRLRFRLNEMLEEEVGHLHNKMEKQPYFHFCPENVKLDALSDDDMNCLAFNNCTVTEYFGLVVQKIQNHIKQGKTGLQYELLQDGSLRIARIKHHKTEKAA